ncbi:acetylcholine receptor subunit alpha-type unc-38-like [Patiria miniata]|uniref:Neurotransmitter-gated ion-channel ligand-binding domain-containing protein n=1 Tax=Patiria miniata TaxID=46514 RepID=A0A914BBI8_PATMI|nr:acetylcholine receptor subunit alpha-type unc-38-like [Patiria miniata]
MAFRDGALLVVLGLCLLYVKSSEANADVEHNNRHDLIVKLMEVHNKLVIPRTPVQLSFGLVMRAIEDVDEKANILRISVFSDMAWSDHRFQWDPANYSGIYSVSLPLNSVWRPDLVPSYAKIEEEHVTVAAFVDGTVRSYVPQRLSIPCSFDFNDYPYDVHTCDLKFQSWTHSGNRINLTIIDETAASLTYHRDNSQWEILSFKATRTATTYPCCPNEEYIDVSYRIQFKRTVGEYQVRVVTPSIITSLLILVCFLIPPLSGGRMVLCSVVILGLLLQLAILNLTVPIRGPNAPFMADFLCFSVFLAFFAAIESVVSMNLSSWGSLSGSGNNNGDASKDGEELVAQPKPNLFLMQLARIIDLVCFVVFTVVFAIGGAIILNPKTE